MKRPAFQFYPADWRNNAKLRRCTFAERGAWLETMCLLHDSDEYGMLRWTLGEIAQAIGCRKASLQALAERGVLKGADPGQRCLPYVFTPTHARKLGDPELLIPEQDGPLWYSSRMVLDEHLRQVRGRGTRFESESVGEPILSFGETPNHYFGASIGDGSGDGATASSTPTGTTLPAKAGGPDCPPDCPHEKIVELYHELLPQCRRVVALNSKRRGYLRTRWIEQSKANGASQGYRTTDAGLAWWRNFLTYCAQSKFLTGQVDSNNGRRPFVADLEWIVSPTKFVNIIEGKYH